MTILDIGELSPAIGAAKLRTPVTLSGDFTITLGFSQDLTQGEFLYALGRTGENDVLSVNVGNVYMNAGTTIAEKSFGNPGSGTHEVVIRRTGSDWFVKLDAGDEQAASVTGDVTASFTFDKINSAIDQPHSDPGSVIHSLRIETN